MLYFRLPTAQPLRCRRHPHCSLFTAAGRQKSGSNGPITGFFRVAAAREFSALRDFLKKRTPCDSVVRTDSTTKGKREKSREDRIFSKRVAH